MRRSDRIRAALETHLAPSRLMIIDESSHHAGHMGAHPAGETHFRVEIVSEQFTGLPLTQRHRLVYQALKGTFEEGLHALELKTKAPDE